MSEAMKMTLTPNRTPGKPPVSSFIRYERRTVDGVDRLVPVRVTYTFYSGKWAPTRITEFKRPQGIRFREWPWIARDERFVRPGTEVHSPPEPLWLKAQRIMALSGVATDDASILNRWQATNEAAWCFICSLAEMGDW